MSASVNRSSISTLLWEASPGYKEFIVGSYEYLTQASVSSVKVDLNLCIANLTWYDLYIILTLTIVWTVLRDISNKLFERLAHSYQLNCEGVDKLPESGWKCFFYTISWSLVAYVLLWEEGGRFLASPTSKWKEYAMDVTSIPSTGYYVAFVIECSFYIHSLYAALFLDIWRKDSIILMVHHVMTIALLVFTWCARYHRPALVTLFLHDICDIVLEFTKCANYLKAQCNGIVKSWERTADIGFLTFTVTWFITRLYLFPLRVIYHSTVYLNDNNIYVPLGYYLNALLYLLLLMNVYWFTLILHVLYKVARGQVLEDIRDFKDDNETTPLRAKSD